MRLCSETVSHGGKIPDKPGYPLDFKSAIRCYQKCLYVSKNDDILIATVHWLYMSLRRSGEYKAAEKVLEPIHFQMDIIESSVYFDLLCVHLIELIYCESGRIYPYC